MPSERKIFSFRPDDTEIRIMRELSQKLGLPMARVIGQALREKAKAEGVTVEASSTAKE